MRRNLDPWQNFWKKQLVAIPLSQKTAFSKSFARYQITVFTWQQIFSGRTFQKRVQAWTRRYTSVYLFKFTYLHTPIDLSLVSKFPVPRTVGKFRSLQSPPFFVVIRDLNTDHMQIKSVVVWIHCMGGWLCLSPGLLPRIPFQRARAQPAVNLLLFWHTFHDRALRRLSSARR